MAWRTSLTAAGVDPPQHGRSFRLTPGWAAVLLLSEGLTLSAAFDAEPLLTRVSTGGAALVGRIGLVLPLLAGGITAFGLFGAERLRAVLTTIDVPARSGATRAWLAVHALVLAALLGATPVVLDAVAADHPTPWRALAAWLTCGGLVPITIGAALWPAAVWRRVSVALGPLCVVAAAASVLGFGLAAAANTWAPPLNYLVFHIVWALLRPIVALEIDPARAVLGTEAFGVEITPDCAGWESVTIVTIFLTGYLWLLRDRLRFPGALLLLPVGVALAWVANALRIVLLVLVGSFVSETLATQGLHTSLGALFVCAMTLGLGWSVLRFRLFHHPDASPGNTPRAATAPRPPEQPTVSAATPTLRYLSPLLGAVVTIVAGSVVSASPLRLHDPLPLAVGAALLVASHARGLADLRIARPGLAITAGVGLAGTWDMLGSPLLGPAGDPSGRLVTTIVAVTILPLVFEIALHGYVMRRFVAVDVTKVAWSACPPQAIAAAAVAFGFLQGDVLAATVVGLGLGLLVRRTNALGDAVLAHATTAAALLVLALLDS